MASEELIDRFIDRAALDADKQYVLNSLREMLDAFNKLSAVKVDINSAGSSKDLADAIRRNNAEIEKAIKLSEADAKAALIAAKAKNEEAKARKANAEAADKEAKARKATTDATDNEAKASRAKTKATQDEEKARRAASKAEEDALNDYLQLSKAYNDAALRAKNYALRLGEAHPVTVEAIKDAKAMYDVLYKLDRAVGQNNRNVGNYKSAFDGLGVSFTQISRELPSLTISAQQFFLAISNNLPMVADEIRRAKEEIAALKAQGQETPSLFKRIGAALISFNVGLSVGIALLTAYGPKLIQWASGLLDGTNAARKAAEAQADLNRVQLEGLKITEDYYDRIRLDAGSTLRELENRLAYAKAIGASEKEILDIQLAISREKQGFASSEFFRTGGANELAKLGVELRRATDEYLELIETRKVFGTQVDRDSKDYKSREEQLRAQLDLTQKKYEDQKKIVQAYYDVNRDAQVAELELQKISAEQREKLFTDEIKYRIEKNIELSKVDFGNAASQLRARKDAYEQQKALAKLEFDDAVIQAKGNAADINLAIKKYNFEKKKLEEEYQLDVATIRGKAYERQRELEAEATQFFREEFEKRTDDQLAALGRQNQLRLENLNEGKSIEIRALNERFAAELEAAGGNQQKRQRAEERYARQRAEIERKYAIDALKAELDLAEKILQIRKDAGIDTFEAERKLANARIALKNLEAENVIARNKDMMKSEQERLSDIQKVAETIREIYGQVSGVISTLIDGISTRDKNRIEEAIEAIEKKQRIEIEAINASALSEQEKADKIAIINARASAQKEEQARKQKELDIKAAQLNKALQIGQIIINTAVAVTKALPNIPLAIAVGALGAAELAVAAAAPVPRFKRGRDNGPATLGIVGDGGINEIIETKDGKAYLTPAKDTLTYLGEGDKVHSSVEQFLANTRMVNKPVTVQPLDKGDALLAAEINRGMRDVKNAVLNKRETHIALRNGEWNTSIRKSGGWTRYVNKNVYD